MSNADRIKADLVLAVKAGETLKVSVLRMLISALGYKQIDIQRELTDADVMAVVQNEAKKRREAIESFEKAGRIESVTKEKQELEILQAYMPQMLSEEEIRAELAKLELPGDFGQAMRIVAPVFKGRADGVLVAKLVHEKVG